MPLLTTDLKPAALAETLQSSAKAGNPSFLVVYASLTEGRSWCGDCRAAESFVNAKFGDGDEVVRIVYAGQREEWRKADNPWRKQPFSVTNLPTLIKVDADGKWEKLVESDVYNQKKLDTFVGR